MPETWTIHDPAFDADQVHPMHAVYPWCGHRWFAYDFVRFVKPRTICELGVHWGTSFFAFCQAVRDGGLETAIVGVDTWKGDGHTGPYGEEVIGNVRRTVSEHFGSQSIELLRMTFDEALAHVADDSQDVVHIDGFHTYEAVAHDFETWLPKLASDGVMMFHDVAEDTGYGSARFWDDLRASHPGFAFQHSWGLGVLFPKGDAVLRRLRARNLNEKIKLYEYKGRLDLVQRQNEDLSKMARERYEALQQQKGVIEEAQQMARERYDVMQQMNVRLSGAETMARERLEVMHRQGEKIEQLKGYVRDRDERLQAQRARFAELEGDLAGLGRRLRNVEEREQRFSEQAARRQEKIDDLLERLEGRRAAQRSLEMHHRALRQRAAEADRRERSTSVSVTQTERKLEAARSMAVQRLERVKAINASLHERTKALQERTAVLRQVESKLEAARDTLSRRDGRIERLTRTIAARDRLIAERDAMIEELRRRLDSLELDVELLQTRSGHVEDILSTHRREIGALMATEPGREARETLEASIVTRERIES